MKLDRIRAKRQALVRPWWQSGPTITAITAILAATVPITTAVVQAYSNARQRDFDQAKDARDHEERRAKDAADAELGRLRLANEVSSRYLQLASDERQQKRVLRFVMGTSADGGLRDWSKRELEILDEVQKAEEQRAAALQALASQKQDKPDSVKLEQPRRVVAAETARIRRIESGNIESDPDKLRVRVYTIAIQVVGRLMNADNPGEPSPDLSRFWQLYVGDMIAVEDRTVEGAMVVFGSALKRCATQCDKDAVKSAGQAVVMAMKRHMESVASSHAATAN